jgi:hypothetical protein
MENEKDCADCKKRAVIFSVLGVVAGAAIGIGLFQVVKRGR